MTIYFKDMMAMKKFFATCIIDTKNGYPRPNFLEVNCLFDLSCCVTCQSYKNIAEVQALLDEKGVKTRKEISEF